MAYFILSLDGGGIRGVMTARLLERLEAERPFLSKVNLFAGTSTGGILALGLAQGLTPAQLVQLYRDNGDEIFAPRDFLDRTAGPGDELIRADYDNDALKKILEKYFGPRRLGDLRQRVLIPSFDLDNGARPPEPRLWKPKFFHNYDTPGNDREVGMVDAALRTTAAPTYFPAYQGYVDGGVVANNPAMCAVAKAVKADIPLADIRVLSLGTGFNPHVVRGDRLDWGKTQWIIELIPMLLDGMPGVVHYQCEQLLGAHYCRLDFTLEQVIALDDVARIDTLLRLGDRAPIGETVKFIARALA